MQLARLNALPWASAGRWTSCACLAYLMVRPVGFDAVLLPVLALLGIVSLLTVILQRSRPARESLIAVASVVLVGIYGTAVGFENPGVSSGALVWIVAPIIFGAWMFAGDRQAVKMILWTSAGATIFVSILILVYVLGESRILPQLLPTFVIEQGGFSFDHSARASTAITFYGLSTLVATAPMWLTAALLPRHELLPPKAVSIVAGVLALGATLVAGRAALTVVAVVVPLVVWLVWWLSTSRNRRSRWLTLAPLAAVVTAAAGIAALALSGISGLQQPFIRLLSVFTGQGQSASERIRAVQASKLLEQWLHSPIFGHGFGATIAGYARENARPWNFELQYHLVLFQVGLFGALVLAVGTAFAILGLCRAVRRQPEMLSPVLVGAAGAAAMLMANASNPYLQAPGNMWPVYFALMLLNVILRPEPPSGRLESRNRGPLRRWSTYRLASRQSQSSASP